MPDLFTQITYAFILAIPIACIAWTVTHEEVFREPREFCVNRSEDLTSGVLKRKFFYLFTCEYCFSHYVTIVFLIITGYRLLYDDWRGVMIAGFTVVWIANLYMSLFGRLRLDMKKERVEIKTKEKVHEKIAEAANGKQKGK